MPQSVANFKSLLFFTFVSKKLLPLSSISVCTFSNQTLSFLLLGFFCFCFSLSVCVCVVFFFFSCLGGEKVRGKMWLEESIMSSQ